MDFVGAVLVAFTVVPLLLALGSLGQPGSSAFGQAGLALAGAAVAGHTLPPLLADHLRARRMPMVIAGTIGPQYLQQRNQVASQTLQAKIENWSEANAGFVQQTSKNVVDNLQQHVNRLSTSVQRGQSLDIYA